MKLSRLISALMIIVYIFQLTVSALPAPENEDRNLRVYSDLQAHWAKDSIISLIEQGIIDGYDDNGKHYVIPDGALSRAEYAQVIVKAYKLVTGEKQYKFTDVNSTDWFYNAVSIVSSNGIMIGYGSSFKPDNKVTRAEMLAVTARLSGFKEDENYESVISFKDLNKNDWYYKYANFCYKNGLIKGYPDNTLRGACMVTRAESFVLIKRFIETEAAAKTEKEKTKDSVIPIYTTPDTGKYPVITSLTPAKGTLGTIITLKGSSFAGQAVKVIFTGALNGSFESVPITVSDTEITVLAPFALMETVTVAVSTDGKLSSAKPFTVEPLPDPSGEEIDAFNDAMLNLFTNLSSELGNAFVSLPAADITEKQDSIEELQAAVQKDMTDFFNSLTQEEEYAISQILSSGGFETAINKLNEAAEILSHSDAEEALDNIAKAKEKLDAILDILTEMRSILKTVKTALYAAAAAAAAAAIFTGGSTGGLALDLYDLGDKIGTFISSVLSPTILTIKTVSAILGMAPTVAVKDSFTTYSYNGDININQYFGSLETAEIAPITALLSGTEIIKNIPLNLTSNAEDDTLSINEQLLGVKQQLSSAIISGSGSTETEYRAYWRSALWYDIKTYIKNKTGLSASKSDIPADDIWLETFFSEYYPSLKTQLDNMNETWMLSTLGEGDSDLDVVFNAWKAYRTYSDIDMPSTLPGSFTLTQAEEQLITKAEQVSNACVYMQDKDLETQYTYFVSALKKSVGMADGLENLQKLINENCGKIYSSLKMVNKATAFYKTEMHITDNEYVRAFTKLAGDLKALYDELYSYSLVLEDVLKKFDQRVELLDSYSAATLKQKLRSLSIDNDTLVVFINEPYSFKANMDFVPPDNRNLDDILDDLWSSLVSFGGGTLIDKIPLDFNSLISGAITSALTEIISDYVDNPLDGLLEISNLNDVDVDIALEISDTTVLKQQSSGERMIIQGLKPGITTVKIYPANIKDEEARKACTIEKRVLVLSGDQTDEPYTMGPRIDSVTDKEGNAVTGLYIGDEVIFKGYGFSMSPSKYNNQVYLFDAPDGVLGTVENFMVFENTYTTAGIEIPDTLPTSAIIGVGTDTKWPSNTDFTVLAPRVDNEVETAIVGEAWPVSGQGFSHTPKYNQGVFGSSAVNLTVNSSENPTALPESYQSDITVDKFSHDYYKILHRLLNFIVPDTNLGQSTFKVSMYNNQLSSNQKDVLFKKFSDEAEVTYSWGNDHALKPDIAINEATGEGLIVWTRSGIDGYYPQVVAAKISANSAIGTPVTVSDDVGGLDASPAKASLCYFNNKYYLSFPNRENDIVVTSSSDGITWTELYTVASTPDKVDRFPDIAALDADKDGDTELAIAWTQEAPVETQKSSVKLAYIESFNGTYTVARVTPLPEGSYDAALDVNGGLLALTYSLTNNSGGSDINVFHGSALSILANGSGDISKLSDNLNHNTASNSSVAIDAGGTCYVVWEYTGSGQKEEVYFARVSNTGTVEANYNLSLSSRQSQSPKIDLDGDNIPVVVWFETGYPSSDRGSTGFDTYLMFARSFNKGDSFNAPYMRLDTQQDGLRMTSPALAAYGKADIVLAWQFTKESTGGLLELENQRGIKLVSTNRSFADLTVQSSFAASRTNSAKEQLLRVYSAHTISEASEIRPGNMPDGNVYLSDSTGSSLMQLTRNGRAHGFIGNDTKGRYYSYVTDEGIFIAETDGTNPIMIAAAPSGQEAAGVIWKGGNYLLYVSTRYDELMQQIYETSSYIRTDGADDTCLGSTSTGFSNYSNGSDIVYNDTSTIPIIWTSNTNPRLENVLGIAFTQPENSQTYQIPGMSTDRWASYCGLRLAYISYDSSGSSSIEDKPSMAYSLFGSLKYKTNGIDPWGSVRDIDTAATMPTVGAYGRLVYVKDTGSNRQLRFVLDAAASAASVPLAVTAGADELYPIFDSSETHIISHTLKGSSLRIKIINPINGQSWFIGPEEGFSGLSSSFSTGRLIQRDTAAPVFISGQIGVSGHKGDEYTLSYSAATDSDSGLYQYIIESEDRSVSIRTQDTHCTVNASSDKELKLSVSAMDNAGNLSQPLSFTIGANDTSAPSGVSISVKESAADYAVFNVAATDETQLSFYELYIDGVLKQSSLAPITSIRADGLTPNTAYTATLRAYDSRMNYTEASVSFTVKHGFTSVAFTSTAGSISENSDYTTVATLQLSGDLPEKTVSAEIIIEDISAVRGQDYDLSSQGTYFSVYMQPGTAAAGIAVKTNGLLNNAVSDGQRTFKLKIDFISSENAVIGTASECIISIIDDEASENSVSFEALNNSAAENSQSIALKVIHTNGGGSYGGFSVDYAAIDGSAINGTDYVLASGTLSFASGEREKYIVIPLYDNSLPDGNRSFIVKLFLPSNGVTIGIVDTAHVEITDDEGTVSAPTVSIIDDETQFPSILVSGIKPGDKITLYKLNTQTGAKERVYGPIDIGGSIYNLSNINTFGSGTYFVTRTEGPVESSYSEALTVTVYSP